MARSTSELGDEVRCYRLDLEEVQSGSRLFIFLLSFEDVSLLNVFIASDNYLPVLYKGCCLMSLTSCKKDVIR